jgi:hypothetical protein
MTPPSHFKIRSEQPQNSSVLFLTTPSSTILKKQKERGKVTVIFSTGYLDVENKLKSLLV